MNLDAVVSALDLSDDQSRVLAETWSEATEARPQGNLQFLQPSFVSKLCTQGYLDADMTARALRTAKRICESDVLQALAWHFHHCLFRPERYDRSKLRHWPLLHNVLQEDAAMFYVIVTLSGLPQLLAFYQKRNIPTKVIQDTLLDIPRKLRQHYQLEREWGLSPNTVGWLMYSFWGGLFHLVRLQFAMDPFRGGLRAFRHKTTGSIIALSEDAMNYRADGRLNGAGKNYDQVGGWTAKLTITEDRIIGHPIAPTGYAFRSPISLRTLEWEQILAEGDPVLQLHIPEAGPMDFDLCGESYKAAADFFPLYFPKHPFKAIACTSWLLDSVLEQILPAQSNLVRHMREMYLYPAAGSASTCMRWVFGKAPQDLTKAPRDTSLRRTILDHLMAGNEMRSGSSLLFPEHIKHWGTQYYRNQPMPWR